MYKCVKLVVAAVLFVLDVVHPKDQEPKIEKNDQDILDAAKKYLQKEFK